MTRTEAKEFFKKHIPSFGREFNDAEFFGERGWMRQPDRGAPVDIIPEHFLETESVTRNGIVYTVESAESLSPFGNEKIPAGRAARVTYGSYAGNPHLYGQLEIAGAILVGTDKERGRHSTYPMKSETDENPMLEFARWTWEYELMRILPQEEIDRNPHMWDCYDAGCRTNRFNDLSELIATAAFLALDMIEGPFFFNGNKGYMYDTQYILFTVDAHGEVEFTKNLRKYFPEKK